ncbi:MAG: hypothetical protein OXC37_02610, partial [Bdellovibrionaceae bacterium]|nr:hypothetical protein [Pseudobdellovibrionaceae bacterium]
DPEDFDVYLNVSIESLDDLVDDEWNSRESREFLFWLINDEDAANVFEKEDDEYDTLTAILREINNFDFDDIHEPFTTKLEGSDNLMEVAIDSGNEDVIDWFMDYINDKNQACDREPVSKPCFEVYCRIAQDIDDDSIENWLDYDSFESYIEDIIEEGVNSKNRGDNANRGTAGWTYGEESGELEDINDLDDDWEEELCGGIS